MPEKRGLRGENAELCRRALRSVQLVPTLTRVKFSILGKAPETIPKTSVECPRPERDLTRRTFSRVLRRVLPKS